MFPSVVLLCNIFKRRPSGATGRGGGGGGGGGVEGGKLLKPIQRGCIHDIGYTAIFQIRYNCIHTRAVFEIKVLFCAPSGRTCS